MNGTPLAWVRDMSVQTFDNMIGKTVLRIDGREGDDELTFRTADGWKFQFYHNQDCCEHVRMEDICGDLSDLIGSPILEAEEISNADAPKVRAESYT